MPEPSRPPFRIDELVARIREGIRRQEEGRGRKPVVGSPRGLRGFETLRTSEELRALNRDWVLDPRGEIRSHRRFLGPLLVAAKTRFQSAVVSVLEGYLLRQREFFSQLVRFLNQLAEQNDRLAATAHRDDEAVVARTEVWLQRVLDEERALAAEVAELREEVARLRSAAASAGVRVAPAAAVGAPAKGRPAWAALAALAEDAEEERFALYAVALAGAEPVAHFPAGRGALLRRLRAEKRRATGFEPDPARANLLRGEGLEIASGDLETGAAGAFGAVVLSDTESASVEELERRLRAGAKLLRPGGVALVEVANPESHAGLVRLSLGGGAALSRGALEALLADAGFTEVQSDLAAFAPPPLELPPVAQRSPTLRSVAENFRRLNERLFAPTFLYAVGRRP